MQKQVNLVYITIVGSGNVARRLCHAFRNARIPINQILSSSTTGKKLAEDFNSQIISSPNEITDGSIVLLCIKDDSLKKSYLEKFKGWRGVIVEPLPISSLCQRNRKKSVVVQSACVGFDYPESTISFIDCNFMSFVKDSIENSSELIKLGEDSQNMVCREIIVPAKTVQSIIDEQTIISKGNTIDLFVADVEGYELQILQGLDFSKNSPSFFLLEIQNSERLQMISEFLLPHKYSLLGEIGEKDYLFMKE